MPDHPHEGECTQPSNPNLQLNFTGPLGAEYPPAADGGARPLPEIISTNSVLSGITSGTKSPTRPHTFGGICAYDGHRANIGRVITDSTWHHFVNINLVGNEGNRDSVKNRGFLASARGQQHLESIKAYYRNLGIWLSRKSNIRCMNSRLITKLINSEQVLEAVLTTREVKFAQIKPVTLWHLGQHARDVLDKFASPCQTRRLLIDLVFPEFDLEIPEIDPWRVRFTPEEFRERGIERPEGPDGDVTWINFESVLDIALGAALVTVNENVSFERNQEVDDDAVRKFAAEGAKRGLKMGYTTIKKSIGEFQERVLR